MAHIRKAIQEKKVVIDYADKEKWVTRFSADDRLKVFRKCGKACFAKPIKESSRQILSNPNVLKFPVCRVPAPRSRTCKISPSGLLAASRRARMTKKYPDIVQSTTKLIQLYGTTNTARQHMDIKRVRVDETPLANGKYMTTIVYMNDTQKKTPYTVRHILKQFGEYLPKTVYKRVSNV